MTDDVLDVEVVGETEEFTPDLSHLPAPELLGWCQDTLLPLSPDEIARLHEQCPAIVPEHRWPDPSRKGATYSTPARRCSCFCHTRPLV